MAKEIAHENLLNGDTGSGVARRRLLRFGGMLSVFTGASVLPIFSAAAAYGGPGDKNPQTDYVPTAEKGTALGVATLDLRSKIPSNQLPDLSATYEKRSGILVEGSGLDPTGVADSTAGLQAFINAVPPGSRLILPERAVFKMTGPIAVNVAALRIEGNAELRFTSGITNASAVSVTADGVSFNGVRITNPNELASPTGSKNIGINFQAHNGSVRNCTVDKFQNGITVSATGEWMNHIFIGNYVTNVLGAGGGRDSSSSYGEDRGDGITTWGAQAIIVGNVISARAGTDARIGIHAEELDDYQSTFPGNQNSTVIISGNIVTGQFRRGIVTEGISQAAITGNTVTDPTWWGLGVIYGRGVTVVGNTVKWTSVHADNQGSAWAPTRSGIMIMGESYGHVISNNTITVDGNLPNGIIGRYEGTKGPRDLAVVGNTLNVTPGGTLANGVALQTTVRSMVSSNAVSGFSTNGIYYSDAIDFMFSGNMITGATATRGIRGESSGGGVITGNTISGCGICVDLVNQSFGLTIGGNYFTGSTLGISFSNVSGMNHIGINRFASVTGRYFGVTTSNASFTSLRHLGAATPTNGSTGDIYVANGLLWVNDSGTWKSITLT